MSQDGPAVETAPESVSASVATPPVAIEPHVYRAGPGLAFTGPACSVCGWAHYANQHMCQWDRCRPLTGKQKRYATNACRAAAYDQEHPRIAAPLELGRRREGSIQDRALAVLQRGPRQWTAPELAHELREDGATVARELRKLRKRDARLVAVTPGGGHTRARWFWRGVA